MTHRAALNRAWDWAPNGLRDCMSDLYPNRSFKDALSKYLSAEYNATIEIEPGNVWYGVFPSNSEYCAFLLSWE